MIIAGRKIGTDQPPYVVAEISANHNGSLTAAKELIAAAKDAGADACKLQCYTADALTLDYDGPDFRLQDGPWKGRRLHELYKECETPLKWFPKLFAHAKYVDIPCFASVFDHSAVDILEDLDCPAYKIASMEIVDLPLIQYAADTGKPVIISTGMADQGEITAALKCTGQIGAALLHCVSGYPTPTVEANLQQLRHLQQFSHAKIGISDHSMGLAVPVAATVLGACIIEKHIKLRGGAGPDAAFSLNPAQFADMVNAVRDIWGAMRVCKPKSEESSRVLRRSVYAVADIPAGQQFTDKNIRSIRPSFGLPPRMLPLLLGKRATRDIARGEPLHVNLVK